MKTLPKTLIFIFCLGSFAAWSQKSATLNGTPIQLFEKAQGVWDIKSQSSTLEPEFLNLNPEAFQQMISDQSESLQIKLPINGRVETLTLKQNFPIEEGAKLVTATGESYPIPGIFYTGKILGEKDSRVSVAIFDNVFQALISRSQELLSISPVDKSTYAIVHEEKAENPLEEFCHSNTSNLAPIKLNQQAENFKNSDNCVNVYFELRNQVVQNKGGVEEASNYLTAVFNEVSALFNQENIKVKISEIFVWNIPDPYLGVSSTTNLNQFQVLRPTFNGDVAHLVDFTTSNGGIAYVDVLCGSLPYAYSGAQPSYEFFPTYSWTVEVITHEIGHNLGSPHTHDCSWPGGAIDNCVPPSGNCDAGETPVNGGTIMSYCHLTNFGINFNQGFGPLPGDLIRDRVYNASCLSSCDIGCPIPQNLRSTGIQSNGFSFSWNKVAVASTYTIRYKEFGANEWIQVTTPSTNASLNNLKNQQRYVVQVASVCDGVLGLWSN
ncbi:MAG: M12 family metallo-peptidase, partial [Luteibaculum sp.]